MLDETIVYAVALSAVESAVVPNANGLRHYESVNRLVEEVAPSAVGCVVVVCTDDLARDRSDFVRLTDHFDALPIIALTKSDSVATAMDVIHAGAYFVLTYPLDARRVNETITSAVAHSSASQPIVAAGRRASERMRQATAKELEVLHRIMDGAKNKEIAAQLGVTVRAVEDRRFRLMRKVGVDSVAELVTLAVTARLHDNATR